MTGFFDTTAGIEDHGPKLRKVFREGGYIMKLFNRNGLNRAAQSYLRYQTRKENLGRDRKDTLALLFEADDEGEKERAAKLKSHLSHLDEEIQIIGSHVTAAMKKMRGLAGKEIDGRKSGWEADMKRLRQRETDQPIEALKTLARAVFLARGCGPEMSLLSNIQNVLWRGGGFGGEREHRRIFRAELSRLGNDSPDDLSQLRNRLRQEQQAFQDPLAKELLVTKSCNAALREAREETEVSTNG